MIYSTTVHSRESQSVAPTSTVILAATPCAAHTALEGELINDDVSQTFTGQFEVSATGSSPWAVLSREDLAVVTPGEARPFSLPLREVGVSYVRITGTMSGAGGLVRKSARFLGGSVH